MRKSIQRGNERTWMQYVNDIIACDLPSAVLLNHFLRDAVREGTVAIPHEIIDLQHYKVVRKARKVAGFLQGRPQPFMFVINKN
ncbi:MAG: hypothetical protein JST36_06770 [Bacteroidetes bacterium]|nr:hypothetical protein [Bacteroidota bacterium]